ncbi:MAG: hypothetical protein K2G22_02250 [Eubacterium sp.]|nr:hypothetical protein [Eubacterium sp.]
MAELTVNLLIEREGKTERFNGFTDSELAAISERLSRSMSTYYTNHKDELHQKGA